MKPLTLQQGKAINEIFEKFNLKPMSEGSVELWFTNYGIMRDIIHLSRDEIFKLIDMLRFNPIIIDNAKSMLNVNLIIDTQIKKIAIHIQRDEV